MTHKRTLPGLLAGLLTFSLLAACTVQPASTLQAPTLAEPSQAATLTHAATASPLVMPTPVISPTAAPTETPTALPSPTPTAPPTDTPTETPFPTLIVDDFGMALVLVPAGPFIMGSDVWNPNERPEHTVTLDSFYIDQFEVSNLSFAEFLNINGNPVEGYANWVEVADPDLRVHQIDGTWTPDEGYADHPINEATWYAARAYCQWRSDGYRRGRLPTEAEWEKAARGTDARTFPWGEETPTCEMANFAGCFYDSVPVDSYPGSVSPYGAYNMAGNVMEWVADWYAPRYNPEDDENPTGPETGGDYRIFRGGAWFNPPNQLRTTFRFAKLPVLTYQANGFRCARDAVP